MSSYLYYENLPEIEDIEAFRTDCYHSLKDFTDYLKRARYVQSNRVVRLRYKVLSAKEVKDMFKEIKFKFWENFGYEIVESIEFEKLEGIFIKIYDPKGKYDEHIFEDFMKSKIITDIEPNFQDQDHWINIIQKFPLFNVLQIDKKPQTEWIYYKPNPYDLTKQIEAIDNLKSKPRKEHLPLLKLFRSKEYSDWPIFQTKSITDWKRLDDPEYPGVDMQKNFVEIALSTTDFALLEGPPGSGKTRTICEIILQAVKQNKRVLLCASTHVAVDNVLERLKDDDEVIAVRMGRENNPSISKTAKNFLLSRRTNSERQRLIRKLRELGSNRNDGQEYYLNVLTSAEGETEIERLILDNSNLVCGTITGILTHPDIEEERSTPRAVFDYLIIDESSKTTFQEFIVPALYCKRWILIGDTKQLSPFVDDIVVRRTIDGLLPDDHKNICQDAFCCWKFKEFNLIVSESEKEIRDLYKLQLDKLGLYYLELEDNLQLDSYDFLSNRIFIGPPEMIKKYEDYLPMDAFLRGINPSMKLKYRHAYWEKYYEEEINSKRYRGNFGELIAWRLIRLFNLRYSEGDLKIEEFKEDIEKLLPYWEEDNYRKRINKDLLIMKRVAFPSILETLKLGFPDYKNLPYWKQKVSKNGFDEEDLKIRYEILRCQHRMHPEISDFPRKEIYDGYALRDNPRMEIDREWEFRRYASRSIWINVLKRNTASIDINKNEASVLLDELKEFLRFAKTSTNNGDRWEIAVLTFYSYQDDYLRLLLTQYFNVNQFLNEFDLPEYNSKIKIGTVDSFQGNEADIVFLSFVKTNSVGFLNSINRLNVAITRARYQLVMIGNKTFFQRQKISPTLQKLAEIRDDIRII